MSGASGTKGGSDNSQNAYQTPKRSQGLISVSRINYCFLPYFLYTIYINVIVHFKRHLTTIHNKDVLLNITYLWTYALFTGHTAWRLLQTIFITGRWTEIFFCSQTDRIVAFWSTVFSSVNNLVNTKRYGCGVQCRVALSRKK